MSIQLITDSTSYIPEYQLKKHNIKIIPLSVNFEDAEFEDTPENFSAFYEKLEKVSYIPTSSQPTVAEVKRLFEEAIKNGDSVVATFLSSKMSGTFSTACMIREQLLEEYPDATITIIDSLSNCMQMGHCVIAGAHAIEAGHSHKEVVACIENTINKTRFIFSPATLEYLRRGGRIGNAEALLGQILQVKPILTVVNGTTTSLEKVRTRKKAIKYLSDTFISDAEKFGLNNVVIHHINAFNEAQKLKSFLIDHFNLPSIDIISIGPVIGTHVGPGAIGLAYETEKDIT